MLNDFFIQNRKNRSLSKTTKGAQFASCLARECTVRIRRSFSPLTDHDGGLCRLELHFERVRSEHDRLDRLHVDEQRRRRRGAVVPAVERQGGADVVTRRAGLKGRDVESRRESASLKT